MTKQGIHRVTADSKRGRQIQSENAHIDQGPRLTAEQREHNARVEAARLEKLKRKAQRRAQ